MKYGLFVLALASCGAPPTADEVGWLDQEATVCPKGAVTEGVDVSRYQPNTDWKKVEATGRKFAIIKATEATGYVNPDFKKDWAAVKAEGLVRGAYHFFRANADPVQQADHFMNIVGPLGDGDLPMVADVETADGQGAATVAARALAFLQRLEQKSGKLPMIYTSPSFFNSTMGNPNGFDKYHLWVAHWFANCPNVPGKWKTWAFWQYSDMGQVNGVTTRVDLNKFNGSWNDLMAFASSAPPKPQVGISQVSGNDGVTLVNWPDKHVELFAVSGAGDLVHSFTSGANDTWSAPAVLDGKARCGMAAGFWGDPWNYAEVWGPLTGGGAGHLWFAGGKWNKWQDLGGMGLGLSHFSTLGMADGRVDVFALGNDGAIHRNYWDLAKKDWSGWKSTGGKLATGAAGITWLDGHGELFAADGQGAAWHAVFTNDKWGAWAVLGMGVASRPVPVRWEDGHVEVFARGVDAQLKHAWWDGKMWQGFATLSGGTMIVGEPSAIMNPKGGGGAAGPEVFARDAQGRVLHAWWNGTGWTDFEPLGMQAARSDPFGWIRGDGRAAVFAVDAAGGLVHASRAANGAWSAWSKIGDGIATCADAPSAPVDGGVDQAGPTGRDDFGGPADLARAGDGGGETMKGGCGCRVGGAPSTGGWLFAFALLALLAHRRR